MGKADYNERLKDYVTVNERIDAFYAKYPDGSLQSEIVTHTPKIVVIKAYAYRMKDDPRPGVGHSMMMIPGTTPYTEDSEVENAETSAWGRALAALGFEVKKGIATRQEIENKETKSDKAHAGERDNKFVSNGTGESAVLTTEADRKRLLAKAKLLMGDKEGRAWVKTRTTDLGIKGPENFQLHQFMMLMGELEQLEAGEHVEPIDDDIPF